MDNSTNFLLIVYGVSILLHTISSILTASFVIPLQIKMANVKNGLSKLRKQMLLKGLFSFVVSTVSIVILSTRFFVFDVATLRYSLSTLILIHAIGLLLKSIIDSMIYHQQYTPENQAVHARIDRLERAEVAKEKKLSK